MQVLSLAGEVPVAAEVAVPLLQRHGRRLLPLPVDALGASEPPEQQDEFVVEFYHAVARVRVGAHHGAAAGRVRRRHLLPDNGAHIVEADGLAEADDLGADGDHLVATVVGGARELVADIHTQPTSRCQRAVTLGPDEVQLVDVVLVAVGEAELGVTAVVFQLPVRWGHDDELYRGVGDMIHGARVTEDDATAWRATGVPHRGLGDRHVVSHHVVADRGGWQQRRQGMAFSRTRALQIKRSTPTMYRCSPGHGARAARRRRGRRCNRPPSTSRRRRDGRCRQGHPRDRRGTA